MSKQTAIAVPLSDASRQQNLSAEEWRAVEVALRDATRVPATSLASGEGSLSRFWRWLTGLEAPRRLADPRLDAIRRFVLEIRCSTAKAAAMRPELVRLGISKAKIETLARIAA